MHAKKKHRNVALGGRGGARENSGRPIKENKADFVQVTCVLRRDTVEALRRGTGSKAARPQFGEFLQFHLDRFPVPTHDEYLYLTQRKPFVAKIRGRKMPIIMSDSTLRRITAPKRRRPADPEFEKALAQGDWTNPIFSKR